MEQMIRVAGAGVSRRMGFASATGMSRVAAGTIQERIKMTRRWYVDALRDHDVARAIQYGIIVLRDIGRLQPDKSSQVFRDAIDIQWQMVKLGFDDEEELPSF